MAIYRYDGAFEGADMFLGRGQKKQKKPYVPTFQGGWVRWFEVCFLEEMLIEVLRVLLKGAVETEKALHSWISRGLYI